MRTTHMEMWLDTQRPSRGMCYLQVRDGEVWACWIGRHGKHFDSLNTAREWLSANGYRPDINQALATKEEEKEQ